VKEHQIYQSFRLAQIKIANSATKMMVFDHPLVSSQPGQFVMVWLPGIGEKPYSIFVNEPLSLVVTDVGPFSNSLSNLPIGARIWVRGPLGNGFKLTGKRHLLVGGGYGAAPLFFLALEACKKKEQVTVCLGARSAKNLLLVEEFESMGCETYITTDDGSKGEKGMVTQKVIPLLKQFKADSLYACGPIPLLSALSGVCALERIPSQLSWEANMRCGIGLCGSCELDDEVRRSAGIPIGWLTCNDGPVFIKS
jgi:dihydroorotate dehydrogenase electron transfer subunit